MRVGSLFSGYGGLDLAVCQHYGASVAWHVEFDKHPSAVLERHYPGVPNYGDVTAVDWASVEPVDIITGGYPCQPFSHAGQRRGTNDERHLWPYVADALRVLRPRVAVFENVAGHLTLGFDTVLADLAALGFDAVWGVVSASDAGAAHRRQRLFIVAFDSAGEGLQGGSGRWVQHGESGAGRGEPDLTLLPTPTAQASKHAGGDTDRGPGTPDDANLWMVARRLNERLLPTPKASDGPNGGPGMRNGRGVADALPGVVALLPTPAVNDMGAGKTVEAWDAWTDEMRAKHGNGNGHGKSLAIEAQRLLPTPRATRGGSGTETSYALGGEYSDDTRPQGVVSPGTDFGPYAAAIARWEAVIGRPAPSPTEPGKDGRPRLSPAFVEWLMGLPEGWVTDAGIPRTAQLKALGNGVVPAQALLALSLLDPQEEA